MGKQINPASYSEETTSLRHTLWNENCSKALKRIESKTVDLVITSPPYFMGKDYDRSHDISDFISLHKELLPEILRVTTDNASICWQVGYHVLDEGVFPLDIYIYNLFTQSNLLALRNRIIWTYGHGLHSKRRFSGRHETILWFTKNSDYYFDLDSVRVPQKYPGKRHYKGDKKGQHSGNPLGKNPDDVWDIPNVKANHIEKTAHPCQFPVALVQRLVRALCPPNGLVLDPFMGSGSSGVAALMENRRFVGIEIEKKYHHIASQRCEEALTGSPRIRPLNKPVYIPTPNLSVAQKPSWFTTSD